MIAPKKCLVCRRFYNFLRWAVCVGFFAVSIGRTAAADDKPGGLEQKIEEITGAHTKLAWTELAAPGVEDPDSVSQEQWLFAFDSRDGRGVRRISIQKGNYSRPLLTPSAGRVVYSRRNRRSGKSTIHMSKFNGGIHHYLGSGYAIGILTSEGSPRIWIYALDSFKVTDDGIWVARRLVRFAIDSPKKIGVLHEGHSIMPGTAVLSQRGNFLLAERPGFGVGYLDIVSGKWIGLEESKISGAASGVFMRKPLALAGLGEAIAPGVKARHVRFSANSSIAVFSAPPERGQKGADEIFVAKVNSDATAVEKFMAIGGAPGHADQMPDIWLSQRMRASDMAISAEAAAFAEQTFSPPIQNPDAAPRTPSTHPADERRAAFDAADEMLRRRRESSANRPGAPLNSDERKAAFDAADEILRRR